MKKWGNKSGKQGTENLWDEIISYQGGLLVHIFVLLVCVQPLQILLSEKEYVDPGIVKC